MFKYFLLICLTAGSCTLPASGFSKNRVQVVYKLCRSMNINLTGLPANASDNDSNRNIVNNNSIETNSKILLALLADNKLIAVEPLTLSKNWEYEINGKILFVEIVSEKLLRIISFQDKVYETFLGLEFGVPIMGSKALPDDHTNEVKNNTLTTLDINSDLSNLGDIKNSVHEVSFVAKTVGNLITGYKNGSVISFDLVSKRTLWKFRAGGAVSKIIFIRDTVLLGSNDNFIYALKMNNADRIWKKRFAGRVKNIFPVHGNSVVVFNSESDFASIIDVSNGNELGKIAFNFKSEILDVKTFGDILVIITKEGFYQFGRGCQ